MESSELSGLFCSFRDCGNAAALATVFEHTAPELLRTATGLCGDPNLAEDLVHATFVSAIERRASFDDTRPLMPWLVGVLTRHAKETQRRTARHTDPERLGRPTPADPQITAEAEEVQRALDGSLNSLPDPLRQVLVLSLRHDLAPAEIAVALGCSPSTVRSRLQRGLALLRDRLPRGIASLGVFGFPEPRGLELLRASVLEHARKTLAPPAPVAAAHPNLLGTALLMTTSLCVLIASAVFTLTSGSAPDGRVQVRPVVGSNASLDTQPGNAQALAAAAQPAPRTRSSVVSQSAAPIATEEPVAGQSTDRTLTIVVLGPNGGPVRDAHVSLEGVRLFEKPDSLYGWRAGTVPPSTTNIEGLAQLVVPAVWQEMHLKAISFTVDHRDFVPFSSELVELAQGRVEVALEWGALLRVSGWIQTAEGERRIVDVEPEMSHRSMVEAGDWFALEDGRRATAGLASGEHQLALSHTDAGGKRYHSAIHGLELQPGGETDAHLELVPAARVTGLLSPNVPRPVLSGEVLAYQSVGSERRIIRILRGEVAADGTFVLDDIGPGALELAVLVEGFASAMPERGVHATADVSGRDVDLSIPMVRTSELDVTVTGPSGLPVPDVMLMTTVPVYWRNGLWQFFESNASGETDEAGCCVLRNVPPGSITIRAFHEKLRIDGQHPLASETAVMGGALAPGEVRAVALELVRRSQD